jgi:hypothetical protein
MTRIGLYEVKTMGMTLPDACIEIYEVNTNVQNIYQDASGIMSNTIIRYKVWADEQAYLDKKSPVTEGQKIIKLESSQVETISNIALELAFPEPVI